MNDQIKRSGIVFEVWVNNDRGVGNTVDEAIGKKTI